MAPANLVLMSLALTDCVDRLIHLWVSEQWQAQLADVESSFQTWLHLYVLLNFKTTRSEKILA